MANESVPDTSVRTPQRRVVRKRHIAALIGFVVVSAGVHFTLGPAMTAMSPRWDNGLLPKQEVAIITLSRRIREELAPKPTPTPTPPPQAFPRTHRDLALLKYREFGVLTDRRSVLRTPARRVARMIIDRNTPIRPHDNSPEANVVVAVPVPTPEATEPPGTSRVATGGNAQLQAASVWGDDNPPRLIKRAQLAVADTATAIARVEVDIGPDGAVIAVRLVQSSGDANVDQAAMDAARASVFAPATLNGIPVHGTCTLDFAPDNAPTT